jgi:hypothetical protein
MNKESVFENIDDMIDKYLRAANMNIDVIKIVE